MAVIEILVSVGLFFGITVSAVHVGLSAVITALLTAAAFKFAPSETKREAGSRKSSVIIAIILSCGVVVLSLFAMGFVSDASWDGNAYHKEAVFALANGWNPLTESSKDYYLLDEAYLWADHYPKGLYFIQSSFYCLMGNIETAKASTLIAMVASACIVFSMLSKYGMPKVASAFISVFIVVNGVTLPQMFTFYIDGFLMLVLMGLIVVLTDWVTTLPEHPTDTFALVFMLIVLSCGTKFTGFVFAGLFLLSFAVLYLIKIRKRENRRVLVSVPLIWVVSALIVSIFVVGWSSYFMNFVDHQNPFYPLMGSGSVDIMTPVEPDSFHDANQAEKIFVSYFSGVNDAMGNNGLVPTLKLPFTFEINELEFLYLSDIRQSEFGPLYSGVIVSGAILTVIVLVWSWRNRREFFSAFVAFLIPTAFVMVFFSGSWWARYVGFIYAVNIFIFAFVALWSSSLKKKDAVQGETSSVHSIADYLIAILTVVFTAVFVTNACLIVVFGGGKCILLSEQQRSVLSEIGEQQKAGHEVLVEAGEVPGQLLSLNDMEVPYEIVEYDSTARVPSSEFRDPDVELIGAWIWYDSADKQPQNQK